ncbi:MAG TPA: CoA transferase [Casimicrobiaceae bacterium]|nr:CoA transferase [Casimicrobiaceae bacterium]
MQSPDQTLARALWRSLGGEDTSLAALHFSGAAGGLPSRFHVSDLAAATVGVATLAAAELWAARTRGPLRAVTVERSLASAAFVCERLQKPIGWTLPAPWDPLAGDYETADGWIRLHTNYSYHRDAVMRVLGVPEDKRRVASAVKSASATELESAVVAAGGCAAALRTMEAWAAHPQGTALAGESLCDRTARSTPPALSADASAPLSGVRVLDLTRVIAGPVGTRYLAAFGADVLRIDPPRFEEVAALLPETTRGKRCTALDLRAASDRSTWEKLVAGAHVLVHGYRPGAMEALGYSPTRLRELNPSILIVRYDAYGWTGPWAARRGFDSLVQMSTGIAHPGGDGRPTPLPAQALDHGTGYLVAAAACRALTDGSANALLSLARTARLLAELGTDGDPGAPSLGDAAALLEPADTAWGPVRQAPCPGRIEGFAVRWREAAGPLGRHEARWAA